jgi:hypothetical protein
MSGMKPQEVVHDKIEDMYSFLEEEVKKILEAPILDDVRDKLTQLHPSLPLIAAATVFAVAILAILFLIRFTLRMACSRRSKASEESIGGEPAFVPPPSPKPKTRGTPKTPKTVPEDDELASPKPKTPKATPKAAKAATPKGTPKATSKATPKSPVAEPEALIEDSVPARRTDWSQLKLVDLKAELKSRGVKNVGVLKKAECVEKLESLDM